MGNNNIGKEVDVRSTVVLKYIYIWDYMAFLYANVNNPIDRVNLIFARERKTE